jgi:hypothetical protein
MATRNPIARSTTGRNQPQRAGEYYTYNYRFGKRIVPSSALTGLSKTSVKAGFESELVLSGNLDTSGTALATMDSDGGVVIVTTKTSAHYTFIKPTSKAGYSELKSKTFGTGEKPKFSLVLKTGTQLPGLFQAGLALTNVLDTTTDANQVKFWYSGSGNLKVQVSATGTDYSYDTGVTLAASTLYRLELDVNADRKVQAYVNDVRKLAFSENTAALTDAIDLIPVIGIGSGAAGTAAAPKFKPIELELQKYIGA